MLQGSTVLHHHSAKVMHHTAFGSERPRVNVAGANRGSWIGRRQVRLEAHVIVQQAQLVQTKAPVTALLCCTQVNLRTHASNADAAAAAVVTNRQHLVGDGLVFPVGVSLARKARIWCLGNAHPVMLPQTTTLAVPTIFQFYIM
jgi:hypothetical protein